MEIRICVDQGFELGEYLKTFFSFYAVNQFPKQKDHGGHCKFIKLPENPRKILFIFVSAKHFFELLILNWKSY